MVVEIADGLWRIPLVGDWVNGFVARADDALVVIDMGMPWSGPRVVEALVRLGFGPEQVTHLVLTHAHVDHAGGAAHVAAAAGRGVHAHREDAAYLEEGRPPPAPVRLGRLLRFRPVPVAGTVAEGETIPGGLRVLHTPGHTPGHISLVHEPSSTLVTGDSIFNFRALTFSDAASCSDHALSRRTAARFASEDFEVAAFTHGPEMRDDAKGAITQFLADAGVLDPSG